MISLKAILVSKQLKRATLRNLKLACLYSNDEEFWVRNEYKLIRQLGNITSKKNAKKTIMYAMHNDIYYLQWIIYDLERDLK